MTSGIWYLKFNHNFSAHKLWILKMVKQIIICHPNCIKLFSPIHVGLMLLKNKHQVRLISTLYEHDCNCTMHRGQSDSSIPTLFRVMDTLYIFVFLNFCLKQLLWLLHKSQYSIEVKFNHDNSICNIKHMIWTDRNLHEQIL